MRGQKQSLMREAVCVWQHLCVGEGRKRERGKQSLQNRKLFDEGVERREKERKSKTESAARQDKKKRKVR